MKKLEVVMKSSAFDVFTNSAASLGISGYEVSDVRVSRTPYSRSGDAFTADISMPWICSRGSRSNFRWSTKSRNRWLANLSTCSHRIALRFQRSTKSPCLRARITPFRSPIRRRAPLKPLASFTESAHRGSLLTTTYTSALWSG